MTAFRPCNGCIARKDCDIRKGVAKALRGQPATSVKVRCDLWHARDFPPGSRVNVMVYDISGCDPYLGNEPEKKMVAATVVGPASKKLGKLVMFLDQPINTAVEGEKLMEFKYDFPKNLERRDEPRADYCSSCQRAIVKDGCNCRPEREPW